MARNGKGNIVNLQKFKTRMPLALLLVLVFVNLGAAETINTSGSGDSMIVDNSPNSLTGNTPSTGGEEYLFFQSTGYTSPFDDPTFAALGLAPGAFLFGPNTGFGPNGLYRFSILSVITDLSGGTLPLNDPSTTIYNFTFSDGTQPSGNSNLPSAPEPGAAFLLGCGLGAMLLFAAVRGRRGRDQVQVASER